MAFWATQSINRRDAILPRGAIPPPTLAAETPLPDDEFSWKVCAEEDTPAIAAFLTTHYDDTLTVSEAHVKWAMSKRTVAVALLHGRKDTIVAFALCMRCPMVLDGTVYPRTFVGNYLCVHTDFRGQRLAGFVIRECIRRNLALGYVTGVMTRVNFDAPSRALPVTTKALYQCDVGAASRNVFKTVSFSPEHHAAHLASWLMPTSQHHIACQWSPEEVVRWFEGHKRAFHVRVCLDGDGTPVSAFATQLTTEKEDTANNKLAIGYFHVGAQLDKTFGTALHMARLLGATTYMYWQRGNDIRFLRAHNARRLPSSLSFYTFGCSAGRAPRHDCDVGLMVW